VTLIEGVAGAGLVWGLMAGELARGLVLPGDVDPDAERLRRLLLETRTPWLAGLRAAIGWCLRALTA
jgi:hypothetical protein